MNETVIMWLLGIMLAGMGFYTAASVTAYILVVQRLTALEVAQQLFGRSQARVLRSPHTPELDSFIDRYIAGQITKEDAERFVALCDELEQDKNNRKEERALAGGIAVMVRKEFKMLQLPIRHHSE